MPRDRVSLLLGCWLALLVGCADRGGEITFVVAVRDLPRSARDNSFAQGHEPDDTLRLTLPGERFDPPLELRAIPRDSVRRSTPLAAEVAAFSAFKAADPDWIVETFADADRAEILDFLADSAVRAGSQRLFESLTEVRIYAITEHRAADVDYRLVFFSYRDSPRRGNVHVYVLERGAWKRTNRLVRDSDAALAFNAFRYGRFESR